MDGETGQSRWKGGVDTERSELGRIGLIGIDRDDLEVGVVVERRQGVAGSGSRMAAAGHGRGARESTDLGHPGFEIGNGVHQVINGGHGAHRRRNSVVGR